MVKEFDSSRGQNLNLLFDATQVWGRGKETTLEYGIKILASAAAYARRRQVLVQVWGGGSAGDSAASPMGAEASSDVSWQKLLRRLALVSPGDGPRLVEGLKRVPPGSIALVVVAIADGQSIQDISFLAKKLGTLVVVTLEGFGEPEPSAEVFAALQQKGCHLVRCRHGKLEDALVALQQMEERPVTGTSRPSYLGPGNINSPAGRA